jgi:hypothetical protein
VQRVPLDQTSDHHCGDGCPGNTSPLPVCVAHEQDALGDVSAGAACAAALAGRLLMMPDIAVEARFRAVARMPRPRGEPAGEAFRRPVSLPQRF